MEQNENLVIEEVTENVEGTTTEETVTEEVTEPAKVYSEEEFQQKLTEVLDIKAGREKYKLQKANERTYGELMNVLKAGTGLETVEEMTKAFADYYRSKGRDIPQHNIPVYSDKEAEVLAAAEADEIIRAGYEEVIEEADRLKNIGAKNMNAKERSLFLKLTDHIKSTEDGKSLAKIGVHKDVYESDEFKAFASKFAGSRTPITEIYEIYNQTKPKKEIKTMGSMQSTAADTGKVKDFYTREEALKFTREDYKKTPGLLEAVENSMRKW